MFKICKRLSDSFPKEEFEDTKVVIRIRIRRTDNTMAKRKRTKVQTTIYKTSHISLPSD